jgi:broad specificity phosphatase PhoE
VRHAPTPASDRGAFPLDEPIDRKATGPIAALAMRLPPACEPFSSPALRCVQTAERVGFEPAIEPRLAECDFGSWAGMTLSDLDEHEVARWIEDPGARPHGGETLLEFRDRVAGWLREEAEKSDGTVVAFTHAGVVKAAVVTALSAPVGAIWQIEAAPLGITEISAHDGRWTIQRVNATP